jgi:hypothetical protein
VSAEPAAERSEGGPSAEEEEATVPLLDEPALVAAPASDLDEPPPPSVRRIATEVRARSSPLRCLLAGLGAWVITVAPLVVTTRAGMLARLVALAALGPAIAGPQIIARNQTLARHVGVSAFLALSVGAWALASFDGVLASVDAFRAILGALAWGVFALSWTHPWSVPDSKLRLAPEGETVGLKPRRKAPPHAAGVAIAGVVSALGCLVLAWRVSDPSRAVFAQAAAAACAVALLTSASRVAVLLGREPSTGPASLPINRGVLNTLLLMVLVGALAVLLQWSK